MTRPSRDIELRALLALVATLAFAACTVRFTAGGRDARVDADTGPHARCGNGVLESGEACDGTLLGGQTCVSLGYEGGELQCGEGCELDTSGCTGNPSCLGECISCATLTMEPACNAQDGCGWAPEDCVGPCTPCAEFAQSDECGEQSGCQWVTEGCQGTCEACTDQATESDCVVQSGCTWGQQCTGSPTSCGSRSQGACDDGCTWDPAGPCQGNPVLGDCDQVTTEVTCNELGCCGWDGTSCTLNSPFPDTPECSDITSESRCNNDTSGKCAWDPAGPCVGSPTPCASRSITHCNDGCTLQPLGCYGTCDTCVDFAVDSDCNAQLGCAWVQLPHCAGTCEVCGSETTQADCDDRPGCRWQVGGACAGTCIDCASYSSEGPCDAQAGCSWNPGATP